MKLLFVCSGNVCRSPMAERLAVLHGDRMGLDVRARSAGILGLRDRPADPKAVSVCREVGIDLSDHRSQGLTDELVSWADHIVVMELAHAVHVGEFFPGGAPKVLLLGAFAGVPEIADPVGGWTFRYRRTRKQIEAAVRELLRRLAR